MKTILVPVDFIDVSQNAADYAAEISKMMNAKLLLLHVYSFAVIPTNLSYEFSTDIEYIIPPEDIEQNCLNELERMKKRIVADHGSELEIEYVCRSGLVTDEIHDFSEQNDPDLIVMGIDDPGFLNEKLFGSVTTSVISNSKYPVLVIPENARYQKIERIAVACDFNGAVNESLFTTLRLFAKLFDSNIYLVNVIRTEEESLSDEQIRERMNLDRNLLNVKHSFSQIKSESIVDGINSFVENNNIDLIVMVPRSHSIIHRLFHEPNTKRMAFHAIKPLLTIHEPM